MAVMINPEVHGANDDDPCVTEGPSRNWADVRVTKLI